MDKLPPSTFQFAPTLGNKLMNFVNCFRAVSLGFSMVPWLSPHIIWHISKSRISPGVEL